MAQTEKRYQQHLFTCTVSLLFPSHLFWLLFLIELYVLLLDVCIMQFSSSSSKLPDSCHQIIVSLQLKKTLDFPGKPADFSLANYI